MNLRDVEQQKCLEVLRVSLAKNKKSLAVCPTGWGKGQLIKLICETSKMKTLVITPRIALVEDLSVRVGERRNCTVYCAGLNSKELSDITISTKQSVKDEVLEHFDFFILDECHGYSKKFLDKIKDKLTLGLTATPWCDSGPIYGEGKFFERVDYSYSINDSINNGFLCDYKIFGMSSEFDVSEFKNLKREYRESEIQSIIDNAKHEDQIRELVDISNKYNRKHVAILCANISHAELIHEELSKYEESIIIHSKLKNANEVLIEYKRNPVRYVVSVMMLSEGFDAVFIDHVSFFRPVKSARLMAQAAGRGLRVNPDDKDKYCLLTDYGSTFLSCGTPKAPLIPEPGKTRKQMDEELSVRRCEVCHCVYEKVITECPSCGHKNKAPDPSESLSRTAILETREVELEGSYLHFKSNRKTVRRTQNGVPYQCLRIPELGFITVFGSNAYKIYNALIKGGYSTGLFQRVENSKGKITWKFVSICS